MHRRAFGRLAPLEAKLLSPSMHNTIRFLWLLLGLAGLIAGCGWHPGSLLHHGGHHQVVMLQNPLLVPPADTEFLWNQVVDTVDNYFRIENEDRIRVVGDVITEGRIDTYPVDGSTLLEPWRKDSTKGFEKLHATLQSIRRSAVVRVTPAQGGYLIDVAVFKELEDLERPENSTVGQKTIRYEDLEAQPDRPRNVDGPLNLGWIPMGRDVSLEQRILAEIQSRLSQ